MYVGTDQRILQLTREIAELEQTLADPEDDGAWCLGDPDEALSSMRAELQHLLVRRQPDA